MGLPVFNETAIAYQNDPFVVVSIHDDSIEWPEDDRERIQLREKYLKTRDISLLSFKPGSQPTKFYLKLLNSAHFMHLCSASMQFDERTQKSQLNEASIAFACFLACLMKVENLPRKDGTVIGSLQPKDSTFSNLEINEYFPSMSTILTEVGWTAYRRHFLAQGIVKNFV